MTVGPDRSEARPCALGDPLAGLAMPTGDPGPLSGAAARLTSWANLLGSGASGHRSAARSVVGSAWISPAAAKSGMTIDALASAACVLADGADHASAMLATCEAHWNDAKALWQKAEQLATQALADEANHRLVAPRQPAPRTPPPIPLL